MQCLCRVFRCSLALKYRSTHTSPACSCGFLFVGAAGTVGIGSALVIGPIMLTKGMLPAVCTAVNTAVVLCSSSSAAVKSALGTVAPWDYCVFLFALCFVCALIGKSIVDRMVRLPA